VIANNVFKHEGTDIGVNVVTGSTVAAHLNSFVGQLGVENIDSGTISATANWWGCPKGPGTAGCSAVSGSGVTVAPWLSRRPNKESDDDHDHGHDHDKEHD
jgi:hypothetical protein